VRVGSNARKRLDCERCVLQGNGQRSGCDDYVRRSERRRSKNDGSNVSGNNWMRAVDTTVDGKPAHWWCGETTRVVNTYGDPSGDLHMAATGHRRHCLRRNHSDRL